MRLRLGFDPDLGSLGGARQCPLVPSLGVLDATALDSLAICPVVQESPSVGSAVSSVYNNLGPVPNVCGYPAGG